MSISKWIEQSANDCIHTEHHKIPTQKETNTDKIIDNKQRHRQNKNKKITQHIRQTALSKRPDLHWD